MSGRDGLSGARARGRLAGETPDFGPALHAGSVGGSYGTPPRLALLEYQLFRQPTANLPRDAAATQPRARRHPTNLQLRGSLTASRSGRAASRRRSTPAWPSSTPTAAPSCTPWSAATGASAPTSPSRSAGRARRRTPCARVTSPSGRAICGRATCSVCGRATCCFAYAAAFARTDV